MDQTKQTTADEPEYSRNPLWQRAHTAMLAYKQQRDKPSRDAAEAAFYKAMHALSQSIAHKRHPRGIGNAGPTVIADEALLYFHERNRFTRFANEFDPGQSKLYTWASLRFTSRFTDWLKSLSGGRRLAREDGGLGAPAEGESILSDVKIHRHAAETLSNGPGSRLEHKQWQECLAAAIQTLPNEGRAIIELQLSSDMTIAEIAEHLGISEDAAKYRLKKAKEYLRRKLRDHR